MNVEGPFDVESSREKKFTYLDTSGRPVVVLRKKNVSYEHNQPFVVEYSFLTLSLVRHTSRIAHSIFVLVLCKDPWWP